MPPQPPLDPEAERRLLDAARYYERGDPETALRQVRALIADVGPSAPALELLGLTHLMLRQPPEAMDALEAALRLNPGSPTLLFALGVACADQDLWQEAEARFAALLAREPNHVEARFNQARALEELGQTESALRAYAACLARAPDHLEAMAHYAALLEESNQPEEATQWAARARSRDPTHVLARIVQAQLDLRSGRLEEALSELDRLQAEPLSPTNRAVVAGRRVRALDALGRYADAFRAAEDGHAILARLHTATLASGPYGIETVERLIKAMPHLGSCAPGGPDGGKNLVFLIGFPRSGTTLLDRMLAVHPRITVLEEDNPLARPLLTLTALIEQSVGNPCSHPDVRAALAAAVEHMTSVPPVEGGLIVDKLPLNSIYAGLIHRLLPEARFIVAIRDPRDVCLSCFLQVFVPNPAMRQFWSLQATAHYYDRVMRLLTSALEQMIPASSVRTVTYEELIESPKSLLRSLTEEFLGIPFVPGMEEPHRFLRGRRIGTPSYDQVSRPLYADSTGRWRHYAAQLAPVLPELEDWVRYWGYPADHV